MRVLHVIARLNVGGTARYITQLANELPKHGIEVLVTTGHVQGAEIEDPTAATTATAKNKKPEHYVPSFFAAPLPACALS